MEQIIDADPADILGKAHFGILRERMKQALAGVSMKFESTFEGRDGVLRHFNTDYRPHFDNLGTVLGFYILEFDVTDRTIMETQLRQAQKMESIGQLTVGLAHDFNNLLAIIAGNLDLLEFDLKDGDPLLQLTGPSLRAVRQGAALTDRMLAFTSQQSH